MAPRRAKKTHGRRKIDINLIQDENNRGITFSKRRTGIFRKATELSTLCGAEIGMILFTACGKAYSFGHPSVDSLADHYLNGYPIPIDPPYVSRGVMLRRIKERCDEMNDELEDNRRQEKAMKDGMQSWCHRAVEDHVSVLNLTELEELKEKLVEFQEKLDHGLDENVSSVKMDGVGSPIPSDWLKL